MSRRRKPVKTASTTAPKDGTPLGELSDAELIKELARRRLAKGGGTLDEMESFAEETPARGGTGNPRVDDRSVATGGRHAQAVSEVRQVRAGERRAIARGPS